MNDKWPRILGWTLVGAFLSATAALVAGITIIARRRTSDPIANPEPATGGTERDEPDEASRNAPGILRRTGRS
jgi:hypothetical protein